MLVYEISCVDRIRSDDFIRDQTGAKRFVAVWSGDQRGILKWVNLWYEKWYFVANKRAQYMMKKKKKKKKKKTQRIFVLSAFFDRPS